MIHALAMMAALTSATGNAAAGETAPRPAAGLYEVEVRLEIPNVWNWSAATITTICVAERPAAGTPPFPILGGNNPLSKCPASNVKRDEAGLTFEILCMGRDAGRAHASYVLLGESFRGRIHMVMGAKNMTMTEVQVGRRVGRC